VPASDAGHSLHDAILSRLEERGFGEDAPVPPYVLAHYPRLRDYLAALEADPETDPGGLLARSAHEAAEQLLHDWQTWGKPLPLDSSPPATPFPLAALPPGIQAAVKEYARTGQQPVPLIVAAALAPLSLAGQGLADVARDAGLTGPCSLSLLVLAASGERKTSADHAFGAVVGDWEREQRESQAAKVRASHATHAAWVAEGEGLRAALRKAARKPAERVTLEEEIRQHAGREPALLTLPQLRYTDANAASLPDALATGYPSAALWTAEAGIVLGGQGMQREGLTGYLALLNTLWDGDSVTHTRKQSRSVRLEGRRLTVSLMVQPEVMAEFVARSGDVARGSGNLARYLLTEPESTIGARPYVPPPEGTPALTAYHKRIRELLGLPLRIDEAGRLTPPVLGLSPEAFAEWRAYHDGIERDMGPGRIYSVVRDWASKSAEQAARLACLLHIWDCGPEGKIGEEHMRGAVRLARWYLGEAVRFAARSGTAEPEEWRDARALDRWLEGRTPIGLTEILQKGPGRVRRADRRDAALGILASLHRVRVIEEQVEGRAERQVERSPFLPPSGGAATAIPAISAILGARNSKNSRNSSSNGVVLPDIELGLLGPAA